MAFSAVPSLADLSEITQASSYMWLLLSFLDNELFWAV